MAPGRELLFEPSDHRVQFCLDETLLGRCVAEFLAEGVRANQGAAVIARPERRAAFRDALGERGCALEALIGEGRLVWLDARETLDLLMTADGPDWDRFDEKVGGVVRAMNARWGGLRAYGEMVDLLWRDGRTAAAVLLEEHWNRLLQREKFLLYCNYGLDLLDSNVLAGDLQSILSRHTHVHAPPASAALGEALDRALREVLGAGTLEELRPLIEATQYPRAVRGSEAALLWVRRHLPAQAPEILARARGYVEAGDVVGG